MVGLDLRTLLVCPPVPPDARGDVRVGCTLGAAVAPSALPDCLRLRALVAPAEVRGAVVPGLSPVGIGAKIPPQKKNQRNSAGSTGAWKRRESRVFRQTHRRRSQVPCAASFQRKIGLSDEPGRPPCATTACGATGGTYSLCLPLAPSTHLPWGRVCRGTRDDGTGRLGDAAHGRAASRLRWCRRGDSGAVHLCEHHAHTCIRWYVSDWQAYCHIASQCMHIRCCHWLSEVVQRSSICHQNGRHRLSKRRHWLQDTPRGRIPEGLAVRWRRPGSGSVQRGWAAVPGPRCWCAGAWLGWLFAAVGVRALVPWWPLMCWL